MTKLVKGGLFISFVYVLAIISTLLVTNRVAELDSKDLRNNNKSVTVKLVG